MATVLSDKDTEKFSEYQNGEIFTCGYCNFTVNSTNSLKGHLQNNHKSETDQHKKHHSKQAKCETCDKVYSGRSNLLAHIKSEHSERTTPVCDNQVNKRVAKPAKCEICDKVYIGKSNLLELIWPMNSLFDF